MLNEHLWSLSSGVHTQVVGPMTSFWAHFRHILAPKSSQTPFGYFFADFVFFVSLEWLCIGITMLLILLHLWISPCTRYFFLFEVSCFSTKVACTTC